MESGLVRSDVLDGYKTESAGKPGAIQTLRAEGTGGRSRDAYGVRGFTPAFQERGRASLLASRVKVGSTAARREPRPTTNGRFMESGLVRSDVLDGHEPKVPRTWPSAPRFVERCPARFSVHWHEWVVLWSGGLA